MIVAPLLVGDACVGAITFGEWEQPASYSTPEVDIAVVIARQLATALENIKTFEREQHITERFRFLAHATERLFTTVDQRKTLSLLIEALGAPYADAVLAVGLQNGRCACSRAAGPPHRSTSESASLIVASLAARRSILNGALLKNGPLDDGPRPASWMMAPMFSGDAVYGAISVSHNETQYDADDLELLEEIARRTSLALEHAQSSAREHRLIQTLQEATLPARLAFVEGASLSAVYRPAASEVQIGGDWYDAYDLEDHRVLLTVGDVTGHGLEASIVMGKMRHAINIVALYERNPARILDAAEGILLRRYPNSVATAFVAIIDSTRRHHHVRQRRTSVSAVTPQRWNAQRTGRRRPAVGFAIGRAAGKARYRTPRRRVVAGILYRRADRSDPRCAGRRNGVARGGDVRSDLLRRKSGHVRGAFVLDARRPTTWRCWCSTFHAERWTFESQDWQAVKAARRAVRAHIQERGVNPADVRAAELVFGELVADVAQYAPGTMHAALAMGGWPRNYT